MTEPSETVQLATALAALQAELPEVTKSATAKVQTRSGGEYEYDYADLHAVTEAIMPCLAKHGLSFSTLPTMVNDRFVLHYVLRHVGGGFDNGHYPLPDPYATTENGRARFTPQDIGSAITYARRYVLCAVTGLAPKGDDSDAAPITAAMRQQQAEPPQETRPVDRDSNMVNAQIGEWQATLGWTREQVYDAYAKWFGGQLLNEADVTQRAKFVQELGAHHRTLTARAAQTAPKTNVPDGAHVAGGPYPDGDYIAQIQGLQASIGWDGDALRAAYSKWNGGRTLAEADSGGLHEFVKQLRHQLEQVQQADDDQATQDMRDRVAEADRKAASDEPPF